MSMKIKLNQVEPNFKATDTESCDGKRCLNLFSRVEVSRSESRSLHIKLEVLTLASFIKKIERSIFAKIKFFLLSNVL